MLVIDFTEVKRRITVEAKVASVTLSKDHRLSRQSSAKSIWFGVLRIVFCEVN